MKSGLGRAVGKEEAAAAAVSGRDGDGWNLGGAVEMERRVRC